MRRPDSTWRVIAAARPLAVARLEARDDRLVLGDEVLVALDAAAADHLHHQVDRELAVEAREEPVAREVDLRLVEGRVGRVPLLVRDRVDRRARGAAGDRRSARPTAVSTATSAAWSSSARRTSYPSSSACDGHRRDEVAAARLDAQKALRDEAGQRMVHGAPRDAQLGRELVQAELRAGARVARSRIRWRSVS